jgi:predicted ATP-grasp superfamily ATP-dependent carboligase
MIAHVTDAKAAPQKGRAWAPIGAVILGGAHGTLAVARSLGRHGIPVCFVTDDHPLAGFSRYVRRSFCWSGPGDQCSLDELTRLARERRWGQWALLAAGDPEVRFVAQNHAALASVFRVLTPPWETVQWAYDKRLTYARAQSLGIDIPRTCTPENAQQLAAMEFKFPVILKPAAHCESNPFTAAKAWRADDPAALMARYQQAAALVGEQGIVVQELIPGGGATQFSYAAVCREGQPVGSLVARRRRQYPIDFGFTSTYVETVEQPEVEAAGRRFLASLNYTGLAEIEFKFDARENKYKILDFNARSWTWAALGPAAGVDFPHLLWRLAMGEEVPQVRGRPGVAWIHSARDAVAACQETLAGTLKAREYLGSLRRCRVFASFALDDPLPGLVELPIVLTRVLARRFRANMPAAAETDHRGGVAAGPASAESTRFPAT